jgi:hypothetical protein
MLAERPKVSLDRSVDASSILRISSEINADTSHLRENIIMDTTHELSTAERLEAHREVIRQSLHKIAIEVETALREAGLNYPIYMTLPHSGDVIATIAIPLDPSYDDWSKMSRSPAELSGNVSE